MKLFNLICIMVLMGHWSGCIQFFVPVIQGLPEDSWIVIDQIQVPIHIACLHKLQPTVTYSRSYIQHSHWWEQYTRALFKALSHMLCIGYGQYPPKNMTDTWLTIGSMLAGATCYALFIGHATTLIQSFDTSSRQFRDHVSCAHVSYPRVSTSVGIFLGLLGPWRPVIMHDIYASLSEMFCLLSE